MAGESEGRLGGGPGGVGSRKDGGNALLTDRPEGRSSRIWDTKNDDRVLRTRTGALASRGCSREKGTRPLWAEQK